MVPTSYWHHSIHGTNDLLVPASDWCKQVVGTSGQTLSIQMVIYHLAYEKKGGFGFGTQLVESEVVIVWLRAACQETGGVVVD